MPESDQRSIHAWAAQVTIAPACSHGSRTLRRASRANSASAASVAAPPSTRAAVRPSAPSRIASASSAIHSGLVQP